MENSKPSHFHRLQNAPHHIKLRWMWIFSGIAFAIILLLWLLAFPAMVAIAPPATENNPNPAPSFSGIAAVLRSLNQK